MGHQNYVLQYSFILYSWVINRFLHLLTFIGYTISINKSDFAQIEMSLNKLHKQVQVEVLDIYIIWLSLQGGGVSVFVQVLPTLVVYTNFLPLPDWPIFINLCHHFIPPFHCSVVWHFPQGVVAQLETLAECDTRSTLVECITFYNSINIALILI